jgi:hypothetical protein
VQKHIKKNNYGEQAALTIGISKVADDMIESLKKDSDSIIPVIILKKKKMMFIIPQYLNCN